MFGLLHKSRGKDYGKVSVIIVAAGKSTRMKEAGNKQFIELWDRPVLAHTLGVFQRTEVIDEIITVVQEQDMLFVYDLLREYEITKGTAVVPGGDSRLESVRNGLHAAEHADIILVHDGARPCVTPEQIEQTVAAAHEHGGAVLGCRTTDTLKQVDDRGFVVGTVDRSTVWRAQTPQAFRADIIRQAYARADGVDATDDCSLVERMGGSIVMVEGSADNIKITTPEDIPLAEAILQGGQR